MLFLRPLSQSCEPECPGQELEPSEMPGMLRDCECCGQSRFSVLSTDSGIERDLPGAEEPERSRLHRKGGIKKKLSPLESVALLQEKPPGRPGMPPDVAAPLPGMRTARVVLLGDDRVLGRLARAFLSLRYRGLCGTGTRPLLCFRALGAAGGPGEGSGSVSPGAG